MFPTTDPEVWAQELKDFVPERVFDVHVHLWRAEDIPQGIRFDPSDIGLDAFPSFTREQFRQTMARLLPGRTVEALAFGLPHKEIPREGVNRYVARTQAEDPGIRGLAVIGPHDDMAQVRSWIEGCGLLGYKPYWNLVRGKAPAEVTIRDMFAPEQLEYANRRGLLIMLHIPCPNRLAEPENKQQERELSRQYPDIAWVLAHIGRAYFMAALEGHLEELCGLDNVYFDLTFVSSPEVMAYTLRTAGVEKVLFGSDLPISDLKGKNVDFNNQRLYVTEQPFAWSMSNPALKLRFTRFYYEELRALKRAARTLRLTDRQVEDIFYGNAERIVRAVQNRRD